MNELSNITGDHTLLNGIREILSNARKRAYTIANSEMVQAYWSVGKLIVEAQGGADRGTYGDGLLKRISRHLTEEFGKGFTYSNLKYMRQFYIQFPIRHALRGELSWTHYRQLLKVDDPFVLEFLGAKEDEVWCESELENALISHLQEFLLELGRGFAFIGRQKRITIDGQHFYPDLVFYNVLTKSYGIIDLKTGKADYSDVGQMQLYVNYYNMEICQPDDNPTIGIILCAKKNESVIKYTLGNRTDIGVFQAKYDLIMPTEEELRREIEITREKFKLIHGKEEV